MIEDELVKIWRSSPNTEVIKFEKSRLMIEVQSGLDRIDKAIKVRDRNELIACLVVMPVMSVAAFFVPFITSKIACMLIVIWSGYVLLRLKKARENKPGSYSESYHDYLIKSKVHLVTQRNLLNSVLWWYVLPVIICCSLFFAGFMKDAKITTIIRQEIIIILIGAAIYYVNKKAVKTMLDPRIEKVDQLLRMIDK